MSYQKRIEKLQSKLQGAYIVEDPINLYYLTGLDLSYGLLVVSPTSADLYVDGRYKEMATEHAPVNVHAIDENPFEKHTTVYFNQDETSYKRYQEFVDKKLKLIAVDDLVAQCRVIKEPIELDKLRAASNLGIEGYDYALSLLKEGITEIEIAIELDIFWKRQGGKEVAFDPIIAFGSNSSMPHYRAGNRMLSDGDLVLMDIGVNLNHYHSDMTRVHFFGEQKPEIKKIHGIVYESLQRALAICKPGTRVGDLDAAARDHIESNGYKLPHSLGHGVGLQVHEAPWIRNKAPASNVILQPGMVITVEPGIYVPGLGGVRLEDTIIINETGYENLTGKSLGY